MATTARAGGVIGGGVFGVGVATLGECAGGGGSIGNGAVSGGSVGGSLDPVPGAVIATYGAATPARRICCNMAIAASESIQKLELRLSSSGEQTAVPSWC